MDETFGYTILVPVRVLAEIIRKPDDDKPEVPRSAAEARERREIRNRLPFLEWWK